MNIILLKWLYLEGEKLINIYKKEIYIYYLNFDYKIYFYNLFFGKSKKSIFKIIRVLLFIFVFKFFWDIFKIIFRFYYITINWIISILQFLTRFYIYDELVLIFFDRLFYYIKYFILIIPAVKISEKLKKRKISLYVYLIERSLDYMIYIIRWRPRFRKRLASFIPVLEFFFVYFCWIPAESVKGFVELFIDYLVIMEIELSRWTIFFKILYDVHQYNKKVKNVHLRDGASLFQMATLLQKQGFKVPEYPIRRRLKASRDYRRYRRRYIQSEITPDYLNKEAIDIYIFLLDLFADTKYELRPIPLIQFLLIVYPYEIYYKLFFYFYYFYIGLIYFLCIIFFPLILFYLFLGIIYDYLKVLQIGNFLIFRDLEYLGEEKDKIWAQIRARALKEEKKEIRKKKKKKIKLFLKVPEIIKLFKKIKEIIISFKKIKEIIKLIFKKKKEMDLFFKKKEENRKLFFDNLKQKIKLFLKKKIQEIIEKIKLFFKKFKK